MSRAETFARRGVVIVEHALTHDDLATMSQPFATNAAGGQHHTNLPRDLFHWLAMHPTLSALAAELAGRMPRLVRVAALDRTATANWFVPWHQDRSVVIDRQSPAPGFDRSTSKAGSIHVDPPVAVLESMVTLRIHLDACPEDDGPLEVIPGSHVLGRLDPDAVQAVAAERPGALCLAEPGDIVALRPLLIHRSQRARRPTRQRVLHLVYAITNLPVPLAWAELTAAGTA